MSNPLAILQEPPERVQPRYVSTADMIWIASGTCCSYDDARASCDHRGFRCILRAAKP